MSGLLAPTWPLWRGFCLLCQPLFLHSLPPKCPSKTKCLWFPSHLSCSTSLSSTVPSSQCPSYIRSSPDTSHASGLSSRDIFSRKPSFLHAQRPPPVHWACSAYSVKNLFAASSSSAELEVPSGQRPWLVHIETPSAWHVVVVTTTTYNEGLLCAKRYVKCFILTLHTLKITLCCK